MARQLTLEINVTGNATTALQQTDQALTKVEGSATKASQAHATLDDTTKKLGGTVSGATSLFNAFGISLTLAGAVQGLKYLTDYAEQVHNVALASRMSTTAVQELGVAGKAVGIDMETMAQGVFQLSRRIAAGDTATKAAVSGLGLDIEKLRGLSPDQVFEQVAQALKDVGDAGLQARLGQDLFGRSVQQLMALINRGVPEARQFAREAGLIASEDSISRVHELGEQFSTLVARLKAGAVEGLNFWLRVLHPDTVLPVSLPTGPISPTATASDEVRAKVLAGEIAGLQNRTQQTIALISGQKTLAAATTEVASAVDAQARVWGNQIADWGKAHAALVPLTADQQLYVRLAHEQGLADQQIANDRKLALVSVVGYVKALDEAAQKEKQHLDALREIARAHVELSDKEKIRIGNLHAMGIGDETIAKATEIAVERVRAETAAEDAWAKAQTTAQKEVAAAVLEGDKAQREAALALTTAQVEAGLAALAVGTDFQDKLSDATKTGTDARLAQIDREEQATGRQLKVLSILAPWAYGTAQNAADAYYQHERDLANDTASTIEERMRAQGVFTWRELDRTAQVAQQDYGIMLASGKYTATELQAAWEAWYIADQAARGGWFQQWLTELDAVASAFTQMAQVSGGSLSSTAKGLGTMLTGLSMAGKAGESMYKTVHDGSLDSVKGLLSMVAAAAQVAAALDQATSSGSRLQNVMGGAATGAMAGAAFGPYGALVGGIIGGLVGLFRSPTTPLEDATKAWSARLGMYVSSSLATALETSAALATRSHGGVSALQGTFTPTLATALNLKQILTESGGVQTGLADSLGAWIHQLDPIFDYFRAGTITATQAGTAINDVFADLATAATDKGGLVAQDLLVLIQRTKDAGLEVKAVTDFLEAQRSRAVSGANAVAAYVAPMAGLADQIKLATEAADAIRTLTDTQANGVRTLEGYTVQTDLGAISVDGLRQAEEQAKAAAQAAEQATHGAFATQAERTSASQAAYDAMQAYGRSVDAVAQAEKDAAKTKADLIAQQKIQADAEAKIAAMGEAGPEAYQRAGQLMVATFDLERASGKSLLEALTDLAPGFDTLAQAAKQFGWSAEGAFGSLVKLSDWAKANPETAAGVSGLNDLATGIANSGLMNESTFRDLSGTAMDQFKTLQGQGLSATEAMTVLQPTLQTLWKLQDRGKYAPDENTQALLLAAETAGIVGKDQLSGVDRTATATESSAASLDYIAGVLGRTPTGTNAGAPYGTGEGGEQAGTYHAGGLVEPWVTRHGGGYFPSNALRFHGGGEVPAWLLPYEGVVNHRGMARLGRAGLDRLNGGGGLTSSTLRQQQVIEVHLPDGSVTQQQIVQNFPRRLRVQVGTRSTWR